MGLYYLVPYQILLGEGSTQEKVITETKNYIIERRTNIYMRSIFYGVYGSPYGRSIWSQYDGRRMGLFRISFNLRRRI